MQGFVKGILIGALSGIAVYFASTYALGYTNALAMPSWASLALWEAIVVFGLGAGLVAFVIHCIGLFLFRARGSLALASFFGTAFLAMALAGQLAHGGKTLFAWLIGAFLASLACRKLGPGGSSEQVPGSPHASDVA